MRTGRSLAICRGVLPAGVGGVSIPGGSPCQGVLLAQRVGGFSLPRAGSPCQGAPGREGLLARGWGVSLPGGSPCQGGLPAGQGGPPCKGVGGLPAGGPPCQGGSPCLGGSPCQGVSLPETPSVNRITHTCKNITLATTSLRPVKTVHQCFAIAT